MRRAHLFILAALAAAVPSRATTYIVDANGGAGVHFTDLPPAVAVAVAGDVILVRPGFYTPATVQSGISILGAPGGGVLFNCCLSQMLVTGVPAGEVAVLAELQFSHKLRIQGCDGTVVLDHVTTDSELTAAACADVRMHALSSSSHVFVHDSRVEISESSLTGKDGFGFGAWGSTALGITGTSRVHLARTSARGGHGTSMPIGFPGDGGSGGDGVSIAAPSELVIDGGGLAQITGGMGGDAYVGNPGDGGHGLHSNGSVVWRSGATFVGGYGPGASGLALHFTPGPAGLDHPITPNAPTLTVAGSSAPGGSMTFTVHSEPGTIARFNLGVTPIVASTPGVLVESLLLKNRSFFLGTVPPSGVLTKVLNIPLSYTPGQRIFGQAKLVFPASEVRRTNSVPVIVH